MNPVNLFKFIEKQKGIPVPFLVKYKLNILKPEDLIVDGDINLTDTNITSLPKGLKVKGNIIAAGSNIESLPKNLKVGKNLILGLCYNLTSLPQGLQVGEDLALEEVPITSLPSDLKVGGSIWLYGTPFSEKSDEEIRAMLTTGYIKGNIYK